MAGCLSQPNIPRNCRFEDQATVKAPQVRGDRRREVGALVVHGKQ